MEKIVQLPRREIVKLLLDENHQQILKKKTTNNFLKEETKYLNDRKIIIKEQIKVVKFLSDNNIRFSYELSNIETPSLFEQLNSTDFLPSIPKNRLLDNISSIPDFQNWKEEEKIQYQDELDIIYIESLSNQQLHEHYKEKINDLKLELTRILTLLKVIEENQKNYNLLQFKNIPTYNALGNIMIKPQYEVITDLIKNNQSEEDKRILQEILVKHVMEDKDFTKEQKEEILQFIENSKSNKVTENCLMFPLTRDEKRVFRILREEIYEQIQTGQITASGLTDPKTGSTLPEVYIARISYSKFFTLYGISIDNYKATKPIKDILHGRSSKGLHKKIVIENDKLAIATSLILQIKDKKEKINLHKNEVATGFIITMPSFLFVGEDRKNAKDYYNQENEGHRRFMQSGNMAQSDGASNIIYKLEMLCHSTLNNQNKKNKVVAWDLDTIVNIARYKERYKKSPTEVKNRINDILDTLVKERYLIESWQLKKGKFDQEQYIIKPLKIS
jgi:hypothetical protein